MNISIFDLFKIGIGPSSSHTVGPMRAAACFLNKWLAVPGILSQVARIQVEVFGSLAMTGRGHGTDKALLMGLEGHFPDTIDPDAIDSALHRIRSECTINLLGRHLIPVTEKTDFIFNKREKMPYHTNGMRFSAFDTTENLLVSKDYYSVGGGFIINGEETTQERNSPDPTPTPYPFTSGKQLITIATKNAISIADLMYHNEQVWRERADIDQGIDAIWAAMQSCVQRGLHATGVLPGGLRVARRAPDLYARLKENTDTGDPMVVLDWVNMFALATSEENAAGGRVVTAPTNGAAGIIPAVLLYYNKFCEARNQQKIRDFLLTAAAVGILYKENASISGAEVGCQGEVGVACSMAAAGLTDALGGTPNQVEMAAEIGMEHNLGLTCDPIGGLVQIPCIERNAMGSIKAINASRMALQSDGNHKVSLDDVIKTMRDTGHDMLDKYKETSRGGLAVNIIEC